MTMEIVAIIGKRGETLIRNSNILEPQLRTLMIRLLMVTSSLHMNPKGIRELSWINCQAFTFPGSIHPYLVQAKLLVFEGRTESLD
jgi:hypothetical protein